jgi:hypothetical protein
VPEFAREPAADTAVVERVDERASPAAALALPNRILAFQRSAGNAAVGRMLAGSGAPARRLQRCGAGCHCSRCGGEEDRLAESLRSAVIARTPDRRLMRSGWTRDPPAQKPDAAPPDAAAPDAAAPDGGSSDAEPRKPDDPSLEQDPGKPIGVCGPDVTKPLISTLKQIESDFTGWKREDKRRACVRLLNPIDLEKLKAGGLAGGDYNAWDTYALFSLHGAWLRRPPVSPPCATPSSNAPAGAGWNHRGHEDPRTCSNTVQVGGGCWLAGTVNYATFGIMVSLCESAFSEDPEIGREHTALEHAKALINGYKLFVSKEDPKWPIEWTSGVYRGGPGAVTTIGNGNRQGCSTTCGQVNPKADPAYLASWDYVWEPVHPRVGNPTIASPPPAKK